MVTKFKKINLYRGSLLICVFSIVVFSSPSSEGLKEWRDISDISRRIRILQPNLEEKKYVEYATGIYKASVRYAVEPEILLAITKQETSFRENLKEGAAGELGICQIRKMWISNAEFKREFPKAKLKDLLKPAKNFMYAAWILNGLKIYSKTKSAIPYWSFYNAKRFVPRLKYYTAVSRHLATMNQQEANIYVAPKFDRGPSAKNFKDSKSTASYTRFSWIGNAINKLQKNRTASSRSYITEGALVQVATDFNVLKNIIPSGPVLKD